ncbi:hypothetical protein Adi01nite_74330 [Amorphoplanes digitatis]|nr:hypothetical protein Adi01nite_74330 [Actinoplanes digitatis]
MQPGRDAFLRGIQLARTPLGGYGVYWNGTLIGWIHASIGNKWNGYVRGRNPGDTGRPIGRFTQQEAVRRIALAAGWSEAD